jgi:hypothetical protein
MRMLALLLVLSHGCSWILVDGPPAGALPGQAVDCTESNIIPGVDLGITTLALIGMLYFLVADDVDDTGRTVGPLVEGGIALGFGISSYQGFGKTSRCRAVHRR